MKRNKFLLSIIVIAACMQGVFSQVELVADMPDSSAIENITRVDNMIFFSSVTGDSVALWVTDGSLNSSHLIRKFPGADIYSTSKPFCFVSFNGNLIFSADESAGYDKQGNFIRNSYLWKSNGTSAGTVKIKKLYTWDYKDDAYPDIFGNEFVQLDDKFIFVASPTDTINWELWVTDGTDNGTKMIKDIKTGKGLFDRSSLPQGLTKIGNTVCFAAIDDNHGYELWVTDGTANGTKILKDIFPGSGSSFLYYHINFIPMGNQFIFIAYDSDYRGQLWISNGTEEGTKMIVEIEKEPNESVSIENRTDVNGVFYFQKNFFNLGTLLYDSAQLWKSDGSVNGTLKVTDLNKEFYIKSFVSYHSGLHFMQANSNKNELWKSDGTKEGTYKISQFQIPEKSTDKLFVLNDNIYFAALDSDHILKLWKSDGTSNGTFPVENWNETKITSISNITLFKDGIYFSSSHQDYGTALFKYKTTVFDDIHSSILVNHLKISPNPSNGILNICLPDHTQKAVITIYDSKGTTINSLLTKPGQTAVSCDISRLKNGVFMISLTGESGTLSAKFIKK
jgi:trimeric autotransporter adhesin